MHLLQLDRFGPLHTERTPHAVHQVLSRQLPHKSGYLTTIFRCGSQILCLETTLLRGQLSVRKGVQVAAYLRDDATQRQQQQFLAADNLNAKNEETKLAYDDTVAIWITWPMNETLFTTGNIQLTFETRGFPPGDIPVEVSF